MSALSDIAWLRQFDEYRVFIDKTMTSVFGDIVHPEPSVASSNVDKTTPTDSWPTAEELESDPDASVSDDHSPQSL